MPTDNLIDRVESLAFLPGTQGRYIAGQGWVEGVLPSMPGLDRLKRHNRQVASIINSLKRQGFFTGTADDMTLSDINLKATVTALAAVVAGIVGGGAAVTGSHNSSCTLITDDTWTDDAGGGFTLAAAGKYLFVTTCYSSITLDATASTGSQGAIQCRYKNSTGPTFSDPGTVGWIDGLVKAVEWRTPGSVYSKVLTVVAGDVITPQFNRKTDNNGTATVFSQAAILNDATKGVSITEYTRLGS